MHLHPPSSSASARPPPCPPRTLFYVHPGFLCVLSRLELAREESRDTQDTFRTSAADTRKERSIVELSIERRERRALAQHKFGMFS